MSSNRPTVFVPVRVALAVGSAMAAAAAVVTFVAVTWLDGGSWLRSAAEFAFVMVLTAGCERLFGFGTTPEQLWARSSDLPHGSVPASRTRVALEALIRGAAMVALMIPLLILLGVSSGAAGILAGHAIMSRRRVRRFSELSGESRSDLLVQLTPRPHSHRYFTRPSTQILGRPYHHPADGLPAG